MQYWPAGAPQPPSRQYQNGTMPLRVSQEVINSVIERKGIRCTHVDALRFFAPAAGPLNLTATVPLSHGSEDHLRLDNSLAVCTHTWTF